MPVYDEVSRITTNTRNENLLADYNLMPCATRCCSGWSIFTSPARNGGVPEKRTTAPPLFPLMSMTILWDEMLVPTAGLRNDNHDEFGNQLTSKAGAALKIRGWETTFFANYGSSFRAPTFFNLYDPTYGNQDLDPEIGAWTAASISTPITQGRVRGVGSWLLDRDSNYLVSNFIFPSSIRSRGMGGISCASAYGAALFSGSPLS